MRSSLALWYEFTKAGLNYEVPVELHFNLWRDIDTGANFFDVGILIKPPKLKPPKLKPPKPIAQEVTQTISTLLERIFLFIPEQLGARQFVDLSRILLHGQTLNAVFNDVVTVTEFADSYFKTAINREPHVTFYHVDAAVDVEFQPVEMQHGHAGTLVIFRRSLCARFVDNGNHYIRFRFQLDPRTRDLSPLI